MRNLVNTKISTIKACHDLTLQPLDPPSLCSSFHLTYWNFKVNCKLQKQTFSTQNKPKTISITQHPKHKIKIQIT